MNDKELFAAMSCLFDDIGEMVKILRSRGVEEVALLTLVEAQNTLMDEAKKVNPEGSIGGPAQSEGA